MLVFLVAACVSSSIATEIIELNINKIFYYFKVRHFAATVASFLMNLNAKIPRTCMKKYLSENFLEFKLKFLNFM